MDPDDILTEICDGLDPDDDLILRPNWFWKLVLLLWVLS